MSALPAMLHALEALATPADESLICPDCGIHLDECTCDLIVLARCEECWHYLEQCECEELQDDAETLRADSIGYAEVSR